MKEDEFTLNKNLKKNTPRSVSIRLFFFQYHDIKLHTIS